MDIYLHLIQVKLLEFKTQLCILLLLITLIIDKKLISANYVILDASVARDQLMFNVKNALMAISNGLAAMFVNFTVPLVNINWM